MVEPTKLRGRPPSAASRRAIINVSVTERELSRLRAWALERGQSLSFVARDLMLRGGLSADEGQEQEAEEEREPTG